MATMSDAKVTINRTLVGGLALACLGAAIVIWLVNPSEQFWRGGFVRVGLVMSAIWIALPTRTRKAAWTDVSPTTFLGLLLVIVAAARFPKAVIPILVVVAVMGFVLRPRSKARPRSRSN